MERAKSKSRKTELYEYVILRFTSSKIYAILHQGGCRFILSSPTLHLLDQSQLLESIIGKPQGKAKWEMHQTLYRIYVTILSQSHEQPGNGQSV